jgi:hypothetical protein
MLQYIPADNSDAGKRWVLNPFNENIIAAAELEVKVRNQFD